MPSGPVVSVTWEKRSFFMSIDQVAETRRGRNGTGTLAFHPQQVAELRNFDTCTVANAIERFNPRLRKQSYIAPGLRCVNASFPSIPGYAARARVRSANP